VVTPPPTPFTWTNTGGSTSHTALSGQQTQAYTFTATPSGGTFALDVNLTCPSGLPDATVACVFSIGPNVVTKIAVGSGTTNVTLAITTTGPNPGTGALLRRRADNRVPWLPLALPLAGIVALGFAGRRISKHSAIAGLCVSLALLGLLLACGGGSHPPVAVTVSQGSPSSLFPNGPAGDNWPAQTAQFTATVTNTSNTAVTWAVTGGSANGTIDANGLYTAPTVAAGLPPRVTITATSQADSTKSGQATETLKAATIPGTYNNIMVTATEGTVGAITNQSAVTLVVQ
jgi:chitinase